MKLSYIKTIILTGYGEMITIKDLMLLQLTKINKIVII